MNLLTIEWQNRGLNLWTIDRQTVSITSGTSQYTLAADTIDVLDQVIRENDGLSTQSDLTISRIGGVRTHLSLTSYQRVTNSSLDEDFARLLELTYGLFLIKVILLHIGEPEG